MIYDVAIIGAGVHGASAAYHLAARGVSTVVLEKDGPAAGPTGRSSGICRAYYTNGFLARVAHQSIQMLERSVELLGCDAGFHRTGFLFLHPPDDTAGVRAIASRLGAAGVEVELLDPGQVAQRFPMISTEGVGIGAWEPGAGYADPSSTTTGLLERAIAFGAEMRLGTQVIRIEQEGAGVRLALASGDTISCGRVLIAAGPWTEPLASTVGIDLPLTVERHVVALLGWGRSDPMAFGHADLRAGYYCKPEGLHRFCLGWLHPAERVDADAYREEVSPEEMLALAEALSARVPSMQDAELRGGWTGLYDVSPDWQPVIGEIAEGVFVDAGTSGHGFKLAPALGAHVADLVTGAPVDPGLEQFHPGRFGARNLLEAGYGKARILG